MAVLSHLVAMMVGQSTSDAGAGAALAWLVQAGVDSVVGEMPRRWLDTAPLARAALSVPPAPRPSEVSPPVQATARPPAPAPASAAFAAACDATTLPDIDAALAGFSHPLRRSDIVPQLIAGNADARVVILCDQIEVADSAAAALRTRMLAAIGLDSGNCALVHRIPWPMPGGRSPNGGELLAFAPFADRALAIVRPRAVLALGQLAAGIAGDNMTRNSARGRWADLEVGDRAVPLLASCHPRLLLNQPQRKREAWTDLQAFAARLAVTA